LNHGGLHEAALPNQAGEAIDEGDLLHPQVFLDETMDWLLQFPQLGNLEKMTVFSDMSRRLTSRKGNPMLELIPFALPIQVVRSLHKTLAWGRAAPPLRSALTFGWLVFASLAPGVSPPPDGGYFNQNTAEGDDSLFSLTSGINNTALGYNALYRDTTGSDNTAAGREALYSNTTGSFNTAIGVFSLVGNTTGQGNTAVGSIALKDNSTGSYNTAIGYYSLNHNTTASGNTATGANALFSNTTGTSNTADGLNALYRNTTGSRNVATGSAALYSNTLGIDNTATGVNALYFNTGNYNTATGYQALESNTTGANNAAHGLNALNANTTGNSNSANGAYALYENTTGNSNTANGYQALLNNTTGFNNVANGATALSSNTSGSSNTANGYQGLNANTTGINNVANGAAALYANTTGGRNTAEGYQVLMNNTTGNYNTAFGNGAGVNLTTGSNNIDIANGGVAGESGVIRIGTAGTQTATYIAGIAGTPIAGGAPGAISNADQLGTRASSARFKEKIEDMDKASEAIFALEPVAFQYKRELDPAQSPQFGLVAEQVEKVSHNLVTCDAQGKPYTVRYEAVNAMLLNEFLKKHHKTREQEKKIEKLEATVAQLQSLLTQRGAEINGITDGLAGADSIMAARNQ